MQAAGQALGGEDEWGAGQAVGSQGGGRVCKRLCVLGCRLVEVLWAEAEREGRSWICSGAVPVVGELLQGPRLHIAGISEQCFPSQVHSFQMEVDGDSGAGRA